MPSGSLSAVQDGERIKLTLEYPEQFDHCFTVERLEGHNGGEEVWLPVAGCKYVRGDVAYDSDNQQLNPTYRALAYTLHQEPNILRTDGVYTDPVSLGG